MSNLEDSGSTGTYQARVGQVVPEQTLSQAISELSEVSWKLNAQVFGARPSDEAKTAEPMTDKISELRNRVTEITRRLREVSLKLELLEK